MTDWTKFTEACKTAMLSAKQKPGRYGGRYVARKHNVKTKETDFIVLADDDPNLYRDDEELDILAQCVPSEVRPIGRARNFVRSDGTVSFD